MIGLTPRLQAVADMVPPGCAVADIGCDHGYVSAYLVQQGIAPRVVAADVRPSPLGACRRLVEELGLTFQIQTRLCSGLTDIADTECDAVILAGMGGELIAEILSACPYIHKKTLILQPMSHPEVVRQFLYTKALKFAAPGWCRRDGIIIWCCWLYPAVRRGAIPLRICIWAGLRILATRLILSS